VSDDLDRLRATLAQLHKELDRVETTDPEIQRLLESAVADILGTIERREGAAAPSAEETDESIVDRLSAAARHYEETHPTLSGVLGSIIDTLSRMGI
jgi:hypothetical protein